MKIMEYGIKVTAEDIARWQNELFIYLQALINAEKLNPEEDYEGIREQKLLRRIAMADLTKEQRTTLTILLLGNEEPEED